MIWCVEDDASIRDIEVYTLTSTGFEARGFDDGVSFWRCRRKSRIWSCSMSCCPVWTVSSCCSV